MGDLCPLLGYFSLGAALGGSQVYLLRRTTRRVVAFRQGIAAALVAFFLRSALCLLVFALAALSGGGPALIACALGFGSAELPLVILAARRTGHVHQP